MDRLERRFHTSNVVSGTTFCTCGVFLPRELSLWIVPVLGDSPEIEDENRNEDDMAGPRTEGAGDPWLGDFEGNSRGMTYGEVGPGVR